MSMDARTNSNSIATFNKYNLRLQWPRLWIIILSLILLFLCFAIAGMEVGHTVYDLRRSTAFGGFIVFIPLLIVIAFIMVTAFKPELKFLRITVILCFLAILLLTVLIAYDVLVLIDPTRCFFFNCNDAPVYQSNATATTTYVGWPLYITWPDYFQLNMNAKRIFQSIQLLCTALFILFTSLYLLTYFIYRNIKTDGKTVYNVDPPIRPRNGSSGILSTKFANTNVPTNYSTKKVTIYTLDNQYYDPSRSEYAAPVRTIVDETPRNVKTSRRPRANSVSYDRLCTRCNREPRLILRTPFERENFYGNLCVNCNNDFLNISQKPSKNVKKTPRLWRP